MVTDTISRMKLNWSLSKKDIVQGCRMAPTFFFFVCLCSQVVLVLSRLGFGKELETQKTPHWINQKHINSQKSTKFSQKKKLFLKIQIASLDEWMKSIENLIAVH